MSPQKITSISFIKGAESGLEAFIRQEKTIGTELVMSVISLRLLRETEAVGGGAAEG